MRTWKTRQGHVIHALLTWPWNVYAVSVGADMLLVDTGRRISWRTLNAGIDALRPRFNPRVLVLTHTHFDHAENAARIKAAYGIKIVVHGSETAYLLQGDSPLPDGSIFPTRWLLRYTRRFAQPLFRYAGAQADLSIEGRLELETIGLRGYVMHTPGHTRGSLSIIVDDQIALVGDTLYGTFPGRVFPPFADDIPELVKSWKKLLDTPCECFLPGHGPAISRSLLEREYAKYARRYR